MFLEMYPLQTGLQPGCKVLSTSDSGDSWEIPDFPLKAYVWGIGRPGTRSRLGSQLPVQADLLWGDT